MTNVTQAVSPTAAQEARFHLRNFFLGLVRPAYGRLTYYAGRHVLRRNAELKDRYNGERVFLLATGTSANALDFSKLRSERVIACNELFEHPKFHQLNVTAYSSIEPKSNFGTPLGHPETPQVYFTRLERAIAPSQPLVFLSLSNYWYFQRHGNFASLPAYYLKALTPMAKASPLTLDPSSDFQFMDGSAFAMLGMAMYLGFKEIFLAGFDYTTAPQRFGHFHRQTALRESYDPVDHRHLLVRNFAHSRGVRIRNIISADVTSPVYEAVSLAEAMAAIGRASP